MRKYTNFRFVL